MKYQKKPVMVEAWKAYDFDLDDELPKWIFEAFLSRKIGETSKESFDYYVNTLEGKMYFNNGDYLIQGVHGEIYSCKPDIFEETYVKVEDNDRISPDEIGNDIHEFLHGGDK
ncbi:hypothetical protein [Leuconostoc mesenteroides]|uniref:hypothetical protein n=1 Tax=Leuconostoc mesenteroides TaxID=1245 RepID=UPI0023627626|nr:hypothetical protein [Leuconostoc mesenteroides]